MLLSRVAGLQEATTRPGRSGECRAGNSRSSNVPGLLLLRPHHLVIGEEKAGVGAHGVSSAVRRPREVVCREFNTTLGFRVRPPPQKQTKEQANKQTKNSKQNKKQIE